MGVGWWLEWDGGLSGMEENKKSASRKKNCAYGSLDNIVCINGGMSLPVVAFHNRPSEAHCSGCGCLQAALQASPFACMSTIRHLRWRLARPHILLFSSIHPKPPSHSSPHPSKPHQIKQPLSKIAVNENAVKFFAKKMVRILTILQIIIIFVTWVGNIPHRQGAT